MNLISEDIWYTDHTLKKFPTEFNIRMVVVKLPSGGLWLHSPVPIDDSLYDQIHNLGKVEHIVAPNCFHHLFASDAKERYPEAVLWAAPGLPQKKKDMKFDAIINERQPNWGDSIDWQYIGGMPKMNEVVFLHKPSRTLICSDFVFNITDESNFLMKILWKLVGTYQKFGQSRVWRLMVKNVFDQVDSVNKILKWDFEKIVMAHGKITDCTSMELFEVLNSGNKNFYIKS